MLCPQRAHTIAHSGTDTRPLSVDNSSKRLSICLFVPLSCGSGSGFRYGFGARSCANSPEALKKKRQRKKMQKVLSCSSHPQRSNMNVCVSCMCVCVCCMYAVCVCVWVLYNNFVAIARAIRQRLKLFATRFTKKFIDFCCHCCHLYTHTHTHIYIYIAVLYLLLSSWQVAVLLSRNLRLDEYS